MRGNMRLFVHVKPGATTSGLVSLDKENKTIEMRLAARAQDGEANLALRKYFAKQLKTSLSNVSIERGLTSKSKVLFVRDCDRDAFEALPPQE
jgi:uncharacterized protein (TIGR00251 family)